MSGTDAPDEPDCVSAGVVKYCCVSILVSFTIWSSFVAGFLLAMDGFGVTMQANRGSRPISDLCADVFETLQESFFWGVSCRVLTAGT